MDNQMTGAAILADMRLREFRIHVADRCAKAKQVLA